MDVVTSYLSLGLQLGRHIDGLVDAYFGPPDLAETIESENPREPPELVAATVTLQDELDAADLEPKRASWLRAQVLGLETVARKLAGEQIAYEDEVERCYGVRPERVPEAAFEAAHEELDAALPGSGTVAERYQAWREGDGLLGDALARVVDSLTSDFQSRAESLVGLPAGEAVVVEYVSDEPWAAFNYYLGGLRSRITVNTDVSLTPTFVTELIAHETYPGHHTERVWKEELLVRAGQPEETILLIGTPQSLIAEGIAGLAAEILLGDEEQEVTASHVKSAGVSYDPDVSRAVQRARIPLADVPGNVAFLLHGDGGTVEDAEAYLMRWGLHSEKRAKQSVRFITDPVWRAYGTTYTDGYRLCRDWVGGDPGRFKRLLTEQLIPADLV